MTVYVKVNQTNSVFPPAKYYSEKTSEGVPSEPFNITVHQVNESHVHLSWNTPKHSNGIIKYYEIFWYPPSPPININLLDNSTSHTFSGNFEPNIDYSFYVVAHNGRHVSRISQIVSLLFDGEADLDIPRDVMVVQRSDHNITLGWNYKKTYDGFIIEVEAEKMYPRLQALLTNTTNVTVNNLAPGVVYTFKVSAIDAKLTYLNEHFNPIKF